MSFYDEVMRELIAAIGAALFVANVLALVRRNADAKARGARAGARSVKVKGSSRVQATGRTRRGRAGAGAGRPLGHLRRSSAS